MHILERLVAGTLLVAILVLFAAVAVTQLRIATSPRPCRDVVASAY